MAKRLTLIAPFDSASGNLSGRQILKYNDNNNPAYEAPDGQQYAKNYKTRYIANIRAKDGMLYFSTKTRTATTLDQSSRRRMASLALTQIISNPNSGAWPLLEQSKVVAIVSAIRQTDKTMTFRKFVFKTIYDMLNGQRTSCTFYGTPYGRDNATINNPFFPSASDPKFTTDPIKPDLLVKFWNAIAISGININIEGILGISFLSYSFSTLISSDFNTLGLTLASVQGQSKQAVKYGDEFVCYRSENRVYACAADTTTMAPIDLEGGMYILETDFPGFEA